MAPQNQVFVSTSLNFYERRLVEQLDDYSRLWGHQYSFASLTGVVYGRNGIQQVPNKEYSCIDEVQGSCGVVWIPASEHYNWFRELRQAGYRGNRILVVRPAEEKKMDAIRRLEHDQHIDMFSRNFERDVMKAVENYWVNQN